MPNSFSISGMTCMNCVEKVRALLAPISSDIIVNLRPPEVIVPADVSLEAVQKALIATNYKVSEPLISPPLEASPCLAIAEPVATAFAVDAQAMAGAQANHSSVEIITDSRLVIFWPLILIVSLISLVALAGATNLSDWMMRYMAGFFIVFGAFKLLDLPNFAKAYARYDLLAAKSRIYALTYPLLEIALGFAFLLHWQMRFTTWFALILMSFGTLGVVNALRKKQIIQCACLGTALKLPMSSITLIENLSMVFMCIWMLWQ